MEHGANTDANRAYNKFSKFNFMMSCLVDFVILCYVLRCCVYVMLCGHNCFLISFNICLAVGAILFFFPLLSQVIKRRLPDFSLIFIVSQGKSSIYCHWKQHPTGLTTRRPTASGL